MGLSVGIREFKARLSYYMNKVREGATLVITEHGKPVGRVVPVAPSLEERMRELVEAGVVSWSGRKLEPGEPVARTRGPKTVADLLLEDRE